MPQHQAQQEQEFWQAVNDHNIHHYFVGSLKPNDEEIIKKLKTEGVLFIERQRKQYRKRRRQLGAQAH